MTDQRMKFDSLLSATRLNFVFNFIYVKSIFMIRMNYYAFRFISFFVCLAFVSCKKVDVNPDPVHPHPFENIVTAFYLPGLGQEFKDTSSVCYDPSILNQELSYGGNSGFLYIAGINYRATDTEGVGELYIRFHVRGFEEIFTSLIPIETIYEICTTNPEQCFVTILLDNEQGRYSSTSYTAIPFKVNHRDDDALNSYSFINDGSDLDCLESGPVLPVEFRYDGYIYNVEGADSLRVSNLKSQFVIRHSF